MRDPMSWAVPVGRLFGVPVKVHVFFFVVTLGLFARQVWGTPGNVVTPLDAFLMTVVLVFGVILVHEFGHCFAARWVGGEPTEVLIWPLGGLAFADVPQNWRAHTVFSAGGPLANVAVCLGCTAALAVGGFLPNPNPLAGTDAGSPYVAQSKNYRDGRVYTSPYGHKFYRVGTAEEAPPTKELKDAADRPAEPVAGPVLYERAVAPAWVTWVQRTFWVSWVLLLFNLLPAYPLDGGQILMGLIWSRSGYRQGVTVAGYSGYVVGVLFLLAAVSANESLLLGLALFMLFSAWTRLQGLDADDGAFGYDFSAGYTSLERDGPPPRARRQGIVRRWLAARAMRRLQREAVERQQEEERFDGLLDKIHRAGKGALTEDERRFLERFSNRYRNRS